MTALAFVAFAEFPVDIAVIEAGMGGEWDATNVIQSQVSVITPIGLDHMEYLGNTLEEIALTKSGIIKPESHVVLAAQKPEVATVLMARVLERAAIPYREGVEFAVKKRDLAVGGQLLTIEGIHGTYTDIFVPLYGAHQATNAALSLVTAEAFAGVQLDEEVVRNSFLAVDSPGRLEIVYRDPTVIIDAAHNPHGAHALSITLANEFDFESIFGVLAILGDKDVDGVLAELEKVIDRLVVTQNSSDRAMPADELYKRAVNVFGQDRTYLEPDLRSAITYSMEQCTLLNQVSEGISSVVVTGSVVTAGESRKILRSIAGRNDGSL